MTDARQIQLQRLVDGQLNRQHIKQMLTEAQSHNDLWRDIAVAFVEDQIFEREACLSVSEAASKPATGTSVVSAGSNQSSWLTYGRLRWITAATLLLALSLGFIAGRFNSFDFGSGEVGSGIVSNQPVGADRVPGLDNGLTQINAPFSVQLVDNEGNAMSGQRIPLITESMAREYGYKYNPAEVPQSVQSQFNRVGYEIKPNVEYYQARTRDGLIVEMPVQNYKVQSYGQ